jgi:hypothetical protein
MRRRVALALSVARHLPRVRFVPVGGVGRHGPAEALVMARLLEDAGVDSGTIHPVPEGATTIHSLHACRPYLHHAIAEDAALVHVCTDGYHVRRCRLILRIWGIQSRPPAGAALRGEGFAAGSRLAPPRLAWMALRDVLALFEDVPLALLWRLQWRRSGTRPGP